MFRFLSLRIGFDFELSTLTFLCIYKPLKKQEEQEKLFYSFLFPLCLVIKRMRVDGGLSLSIPLWLSGLLQRYRA